MAASILATKLFIPPPRPKVVLRPRLVERMNAGLHRKLTLISAPAGFGKTTLVSSWIDDLPDQVVSQEKIGIQQSKITNRVAWLSLDEADNDLVRFLSHFIAALQTISASLGEGAWEALQAPQRPSTESILTFLLNDVATITEHIILVLDDYHLIDSPQIDQALTFLIGRLPPQMHLIITTREDPDLPLARLRARDQLTELRVKDLRFTLAEAAGFLNQTMGLNLSTKDISALETRTEGWIAGLQLAALALQGTISLQGHPDTVNFIKSFTGSHRFVMDYLVEEVLQQQPENIQTFLLQTAILDRMCASLCDDLLLNPVATAQETLAYLERANLLLVPLDDKHEWYRYHHLFADVLQARLMKQQPKQVVDLHRRAYTWWEQNDFRADAIRHALAAEDFDHAADLIELEREEHIGRYFQLTGWLGWVRALPDELVRNRPHLSIGYAWELLFLGELEAAEARLQDVDRLLALSAIPGPEATSTTESPASKDVELRLIQVSLNTARAFQSQALGDMVNTVKFARQALALTPETDYYRRGIVGSLLGLAYLTNGELETAYQYAFAAMTNLRLDGNLLYVTTSMFVLGDIRVTQGRLLDAIAVYEQALQLVNAAGNPLLQSTASLFLRLSELYYEQGFTDIARQHLLRSEELSKSLALDDWPYHWQLVQARLKEGEGDLDGTLQLLDEAERLYHRSPLPDVRPVGALKTRVWLKQGKLTKALGWVRERALAVTDDLSYLREFEYMLLVRVLMAQYSIGRSPHSLHEAIQLLDRLMKTAEAGGRLRNLMEILILRALAHQAQNNLPVALVSLERALTLAEPEGYVRLFVDEGLAMAELLAMVKVENGRLADYIDKLLAAFGLPDASHPAAELTITPNLQPPFKLLSQRELEILQLIAQGLSNREISQQLFLALDTVKGHNRKIFDKLQVKRRTEAVARAHELGLL